MARKNLLGALMEAKLPAGNLAEVEPWVPQAPASALISQGAIGAVSRSIEQLKQQVSEAGRLQAQLTAGQTIVEIDTDVIDGSPVSDRLAVSDESETILLESIREQGQQVPILVRPHPTKTGRYQVAYGHRRLRAARSLDRPVRAVVRALTNDELVIAQGVENSARADLSFIERALYAASLESAGFGRETIMAALGLDKTAVSKLIGVPSKISETIIRSIGPAPKVGRDRWLQLAECLDGKGALQRVQTAQASDGFSAASSDNRFELVLKAAATKSKQRANSGSTLWRDPDGKKLGKFADTPTETIISLDRKALPGFGDFVRANLPELLSEFRRRQGSK